MGEISMATDGYNERGSIRAQRMMAAEGYNERGSIRTQAIRQLRTNKTLQQQLERNNGKGVQATCGGTKKSAWMCPGQITRLYGRKDWNELTEKIHCSHCGMATINRWNSKQCVRRTGRGLGISEDTYIHECMYYYTLY